MYPNQPTNGGQWLVDISCYSMKKSITKGTKILYNSVVLAQYTVTVTVYETQAELHPAAEQRERETEREREREVIAITAPTLVTARYRTNIRCRMSAHWHTSGQIMKKNATVTSCLAFKAFPHHWPVKDCEIETKRQFCASSHR